MNIKMSERGILAGDNNINAKINEVIDCLGAEGGTITLDKGTYYFNDKNAVVKLVYMTNTVSEKEAKEPTRVIGIDLVNRHNITIDGNGSNFIYSGRMTEFCMQNCTNIVIKNLFVDFDMPTVVEFKVVKVDGTKITIDIPSEHKYSLASGKLLFDALESVDGGVVVQQCDVEQKFTKRIGSMSWWGNVFDKQLGAVKNEDGTVTFSLLIHEFKTGYVYQACKVKRDACSTFIDRCKNVKLENMQYYFMHGMGVLCQLSENVTIEKCNFTPNTDKGRTTTAFADLVHCSMCRGDIVVKDCKFDGSRDDVLNVHGNHYLIKKIIGNKVILEFRHPQSYGFLGIFAGDEVEFVNKKTLVPVEKAIVTDSKLLDKYTTEITLSKPTVKGKAGMVIDNSSAAANVLFENNEMYNIPTRGCLLTTKGKVVIRNNLFHNIYMSAILVSDDTKNWFESGYVRDILVENNRFINCSTWVIDILPEAHTLFNKPIVHENIRVINNYIEHNNRYLIRVKRTKGFTFKGNEIKSSCDLIKELRDNRDVVIEL